MKILMALERDFPPDLRVENEIKSLFKAGHTIILACYTFAATDRVEEWNGCRIYKNRISKFTHKSSVGALKLPFYFNFWRNSIQKIIRNENPDAIHIHDLPLARLGYEMKRKFGLKFVLDLHENWPAFLRISRHANTFIGRILSSNRSWEKYEIDSCRQADRVIVVIEEAKERLVKLGIPDNKITIVANYPLLSDFDEIKTGHTQPVDKHTLFYAGGINEHRGLQYVIRALPELKKRYPGIECWILGDGNYRATLENMVGELDIQQNVIFFGQVPYKTVLEKLAESTITLIPHVKSEHTDSTIPHKLFQYMYCGKRILASNCSPLERIIKASNAGFIYQWNSPADFVKAFRMAFNDKSYNPSEVKKKVAEKYNWVSQQQKLVRLYSK